MEEQTIKYISLAEAAKMTSYSQDYISLLCRRKKIRGAKLGRNWVTTEEWVQDYINKTDGSGQIIVPVKIVRSKSALSRFFKKTNKLLDRTAEKNTVNLKNIAPVLNAEMTKRLILTKRFTLATAMSGFFIIFSVVSYDNTFVGEKVDGILTAISSRLSTGSHISNEVMPAFAKSNMSADYATSRKNFVLSVENKNRADADTTSNITEYDAQKIRQGLYAGLSYESQGDIPKAIDRLASLGSLSRIEQNSYKNSVSGLLYGKNIDLEVALNLGRIYYDDGQMEKAKDVFLKILKLYPKNANAHFALGLVFRRENNFSAALAEFKTAMFINPGDRNIIDGIQELEANYGTPEDSN